ncbi:MAG: hypothetical protein N3E51_02945 [Candidatus Micrarchaeota archaeon]|nr:hypothetical protein [Candidatus Micrarchaeota archaeon]
MRAQSFGVDFVAGLTVFLLLVGYFLVFWDLFSVGYVESLEKGNTDIAAISISDALVSAPGEPYNWTDDPLNAKMIGFASKPGVLDWNRVAAFSALPYANARELLGAERDFWLKIETLDGARLASMGKEPQNATRAAEVARMAIMDGRAVAVRLQLYE